jgi:DNA polymerase-3 subunit beta
MNPTTTKNALVVNSKTLYYQLKKLAAALPSRSVLPIIENFLFDITANTLRLVSTNLEISMTTAINLESTQEDRAVAVPGKVILDILSELPEQPIIISFSTNTMQITADSGKYKIACEDGKDFPQVPIVSGAVMRSKELGEGIKKVLYAASSDEDKAALNGVYITSQDGKLTFVATDAHRLQVCRTSENIGEDPDIIIPLRAAAIIAGLVDSSAEIKMQAGRSNVLFTAGGINIFCRLIDQKYPNYEGVIPTQNNKFLEVEKKTFLKALKRVKIFANKSTYQVKMSVAGSLLTLECEDPDFANKANEQIECEYIGEGSTIGFNAELLYDTCARTDGDILKIEMSEANRPAIILPEMQTGGTHNLGLVMPIMLNSYE